jgi:hypothetical protein
MGRAELIVTLGLLFVVVRNGSRSGVKIIDIVNKGAAVSRRSL